MPRRTRWWGLVALALLAAACSDDGGSAATTTTAPSTTTASEVDAELRGLLLTAADLPDGYGLVKASADTVTTFCIGQDATAGLQATGRALVTFARTPKGAGVVQVVFQFKKSAASAFVSKATQLFAACNEVPDAQGLAFTYTPAATAVEEALAPTTAHIARNGTSVGSGSLLSTTAVFQVGDDVGELIGILGVDQPRAELDALAATAVDAAVAKTG